MIEPRFGRLPLEEVPPRQRAIDEAADAAGRDPRAVRRIANLNGEITDGSSSGFLRGPASQRVDDLRRLVEAYGFEDFIFSGDGDPNDQLGGSPRTSCRLCASTPQARRKQRPS